MIEEAERLELQRQLEEVELAQLEQESLEHETIRLQEEVEAEEEFRDILRMSLVDAACSLEKTYQMVSYHQHASLDDRHGRDEAALATMLAKRQAQIQEQGAHLLVKIQSNINKRKDNLSVKHEVALAELATKHEEQEDDLFLQIQLHLRGKPNREAREKRLRDEIRKQQKQESDVLERTHNAETGLLDDNARMEMQGVERSTAARIARAVSENSRSLNRLSREAVFDRYWFELVSRRRANMLAEHSRMMLAELEAGTEPFGLTEELAAAIGPLLPAGDCTATSAADTDPYKSTPLSELDANSTTPQPGEADTHEKTWLRFIQNQHQIQAHCQDMK